MSGLEILTASPMSAYRADVNGQDAPFGRDDDHWLVAANALHLAASSERPRRKHRLYDALGQAIDLLGDERIDRFVEREWNGERSYVESMVVLADVVHWAGALRLAAVMFDDLLRAATDLSTVERGRVLALRARVERKLERLDDAADRYEYVAELG